MQNTIIYYDYENRLVSIEKSDGGTGYWPVVEYTYDALGRRIHVQKYNNGSALPGLRYYYNDRWQVLDEFTYNSGTGQLDLVSFYIYGNYIDKVIYSSGATGSPNFYLHDHLYSPAAIVNKATAETNS